jgi:hypothetical protein
MDNLDDLREQFIQAEEEIELEEQARANQPFLDLVPQQRFILALLLFFNVALCGCMALVMMGRVSSPF